MNADSVHVSGVSLRLKRTDSASSTVCGTQLELWLFKVKPLTTTNWDHNLWTSQRGSFVSVVCLCVFSGVGPHPRALSGRVVCCSWWLFTVVLLSCYFSNLSSPKSQESTQPMVKGFEDLANQDTMEYGCLAGSSTLAFFKVRMKRLIF